MKEEYRITNERARKVFIADDETEFSSKHSCEAYEWNLQIEEAIKRLQEIPRYEYTPSDMACYESWIWYYAKDEGDIDTILHALFDIDSTAASFKAEKYPTWVLARVDEDHGGTLTAIETFVKDTTQLVNQICDELYKRTEKIMKEEKKC